MSSRPPELSIVIPAFNEAATIAATVLAWRDEARRLGLEHEILVYDDGSTDATGAVLDALASEVVEVHAHHHANRGHGPTVLKGYREARGKWILQIDGDDEIGTEPFEWFWTNRESYDVLVGTRRGRRQSIARRLLTLASRAAVGVLFGGRVSDVNAPYRLMRRASLEDLLPAIPDTMFAPNVAVVALAVRLKMNIAERPVPSRPAARRRPASWSALHAGWRSFTGLLAVARLAGARRVDPAVAQRTTR